MMWWNIFSKKSKYILSSSLDNIIFINEPKYKIMNDISNDNDGDDDNEGDNYVDDDDYYHVERYLPAR